MKRRCVMICLLATSTVCQAAPRVVYNAEGDALSASDKLTSDGAQNGVFVSDRTDAVIHVDVSATPRFGYKAFQFQNAARPNDVIEIPDTTDMGTAFTLAAFVSQYGTGYQRLFANMNDNTISSDDLLFSFTGVSNAVYNLEAYVNGSTYVRAFTPAFTGAYHHLAMTYSNGVVKLYLDGNLATNGTAQNSGSVVLGRNLRVGENYAGNTWNNQLYGKVDDIVVWDTALGQEEILDLAMNGAAVLLSPHAPPCPRVVYTAEHDTGGATDKFEADGCQNGTFVSDRNDAVIHVDTSATPKFGNRAFLFTGEARPNDVIEIADTLNLGRAFTLAAFVSPIGSGAQRLFGNLEGNGFSDRDLLVSFCQVSNEIYNLEAYVNGYGTSYVRAFTPAFNDGEYHHVAMTYSNGVVKLYLDGTLATNGTSLYRGPVMLGRNLRVGENYAGNTWNNQLYGRVDDVVVWDAALGPNEILTLSLMGAAKTLLYPSGTIILLQ